MIMVKKCLVVVLVLAFLRFSVSAGYTSSIKGCKDKNLMILCW